MSRVKAPEARTPLRGRGRSQLVHVTPAADDHAQLMAHVAAGDLSSALTFAAGDARWLRPADAPALVLAQLIARELAGPARGGLSMAPPPDATDEVGTVPAFPDLDGGARSHRGGSLPPAGAPPLRSLAPLLVALLSGLGLMPEARARLGITLVEEPEPDVPRPVRMPRRSA